MKLTSGKGRANLPRKPYRLQPKEVYAEPIPCKLPEPSSRRESGKK